MADLVERLRETYESVVTGNDVLRNPDGPEAAARIQQLEAALREMLEYDGGAKCGCDDPYVMERARAALEDRT